MPVVETNAEKDLKYKFQLSLKLLLDHSIAQREAEQKAKQKEIMKDQQTKQQELTSLQTRLDELVLDFHDRSASQAPKQEIQELSLKIGIVKNIMNKVRAEIAKDDKKLEKQTNPPQAALKALHSRVTEGIFNDSMNKPLAKFGVVTELNPVETTIAERRTEAATIQKEFETTKPVLAAFEVEADVNFRNEYKTQALINDQAVLQKLSKSSVEDLISYKLRDDRKQNLLTLDDLRLKQVMVAKELRALQGTDTFVDTSNALQFYENMIAQNGSYSRGQHNRTLDDRQQAPQLKVLAQRNGASLNSNAKRSSNLALIRLNTISERL